MSLFFVIDLIFLFLLMQGVGVATNTDKLRGHFQRPKGGLLVGLFCQFVVLPPLSFMVGWLYELPPIHRVALVVTGCCPGGAMSNILCFLARADLDLSVAMTTASSFVSILAMPVNIYVYITATGLADEAKLDYVSIGASAVVVVVGISFGYFVKVGADKKVSTSDDPKVHRSNNLKLRFFAVSGFMGGLATLVIGVVKNAKSSPAWEEELGVYAAAESQCLCGLFMGFSIAKLVGKLPNSSCVAVSVETSVQNIIIAMAILNITFEEDEERAGESMVIPMAYSALGSSTALLWLLIAMKLGLTDVEKDFSVKDVFKSYMSSVSAGGNSGG